MYSKTIGDLADDGMSQFQRLQCLKSYRVIIGTFAAISYLLEGQSLWNYFTHSVIDEAGQCTEIDALVPMALVGKRGQTIMAGDPMQMSPLVINEYASTRGLTMSMLSRLIECYSNINNNVSTLICFFGKLHVLFSSVNHNKIVLFSGCRK